MVVVVVVVVSGGVVVVVVVVEADVVVVDSGTVEVEVVLDVTAVGSGATEDDDGGAAVVEGVDVAADAARVATGTRSGDGRVVTSSRTLETADVARTIEAAVAASQAKTWPALRFMWQW